jgi:glucose/arabinose dehydrogenase
MLGRAGLIALLTACHSSSATVDAPLGDGPLGDGPPGDAAAGASDAGPRPFPTVKLALVPVATNLSQPIAITVPPGESRPFVGEKTGTVSIIENGQPRTPAFIDIQNQVSQAEEEGLLGIAFHPDYAANGRVFVYWTGADPDTTESDKNCHVWEFHRGADANVTDGTHKEILDIPHPAANHNGGDIAFGPDGMLYIGVGDGGGGNGQYGTTRVLTTRLSKMLRIDVDHGDPYAHPADNPFADMAADEAKDIWLWGLRNPWRWSFDRQTGDMWIGDVGQNCFEEIDFIAAGQKGLDFGWNIVEGMGHTLGAGCSSPQSNHTGVWPVLEYTHANGANAVIGGYVYRGPAIPALQGMYFFSDNGAGFVRSFWADQPVPFAQTMEWPKLTQAGISAFGEDAAGELLVCSISQNECWQIVAQ